MASCFAFHEKTPADRETRSDTLVALARGVNTPTPKRRSTLAGGFRRGEWDEPSRRTRIGMV
jgi:hypothetical protein